MEAEPAEPVMQTRSRRVTKNEPRFETGARIADESIDSVFPAEEDGDRDLFPLPAKTAAATGDENPLFAEEPVSSDGVGRRQLDAEEPELFADEDAILQSTGTGPPPPLWLARGALALGAVMLVIGLLALARSSPPPLGPPSPVLAPPSNAAIPPVASAQSSQRAATPPEPTASSPVATNYVASVTEQHVAEEGLPPSTAEPVAAAAEVSAVSQPPSYLPLLPRPEPITGLGETAIRMAALPRPLPAPPAAASAMPAEPSGRPRSLDETAGVREVLSRYVYAYAALDARAVAAVWPTVNQAALGRAFAALETQNISFSRCEVTVSGGTARAVCAGTAAWTPKVGGRTPREDERTWTFALAHRDDSWAIVSAEMR